MRKALDMASSCRLMAAAVVAVFSGLAPAGEPNPGRPAAPAEPPRPGQVFDRLDADGDGRISREEFSRQAPEIARRRSPAAPVGGGVELERRLRVIVEEAVRDALRKQPGAVPALGPRGPGFAFAPPAGSRPLAGPSGPAARERDGRVQRPAERAKRAEAGAGARAIDRNRDGKLQAEEIRQAIERLQRLLETSEKGDIDIQQLRAEKHRNPGPRDVKSRKRR